MVSWRHGVVVSGADEDRLAHAALDPNSGVQGLNEGLRPQRTSPDGAAAEITGGLVPVAYATWTRLSQHRLGSTGTRASRPKLWARRGTNAREWTGPLRTGSLRPRIDPNRPEFGS